MPAPPCTRIRTPGSGKQSVRARNESAWLLPNDGSRTNHGLCRDMRRFADSDEIDMDAGLLECAVTLSRDISLGRA